MYCQLCEYYTVLHLRMNDLKLKLNSIVFLRIWFWVNSPTNESPARFSWPRDSVYGATILLGVGGATVLVLSMAMISHVVGEFAVSFTLLQLVFLPLGTVKPIFLMVLILAIRNPPEFYSH